MPTQEFDNGCDKPRITPCLLMVRTIDYLDFEISHHTFKSIDTRFPRIVPAN